MVDYTNNKISILILFIVFSLCCIESVGATQISRLADKIAFLKDGEVWISNKEGRAVEQITKTNGKVEGFLFSPTLRCLAYSKIIKYVDAPGLYEEGEEPGRVNLSSIVIVDLGTKKQLREIRPKDDWLELSKWMSGTRLLFYESSGFDVSDYYEFDTHKNIQKKLDYEKGYLFSEADFSRDGSLMVYEDFSLRMVDVKSNKEEILASKDNMREPKISNDKKYVAFIEAEPMYDNLWIYSIRDRSVKRLYRGHSWPKTSDIKRLSWSFDNKYLSIFYPSGAVVVEVQNPNNTHRIQGKEFSWVRNESIAFVQDGDIYLYDLNTKKVRLFFKGASNPAFLYESSKR